MKHFKWILSVYPAIAAALLLAGCTVEPKEDFKTPTATNAPIEEVHGTHKPGPHGGQLLDLGEHEYMAEVVFQEADPKTITIYLVEHDDTSKSVQSDQKDLSLNGLKVGSDEVLLKLAAKPQEGDDEGKTSRYEISGGGIPEGIEDMHELEEGTFSVTINGKPYSGTIEHGAHDDHDHDHGHDDHEKHDDDKDHDHKDGDKDHKEK